MRNSCNYLFCLTGICASQSSGAVPDTHSIFRLLSTQHGLRNSLAFHPKAVCSVPILTCTIFHFVGSLYESSHYSSFRYAPNHLRGYLAGIIAAQKEVWGIDLISPVLTPGRLAEFTAFMPYSGAEYEMLTAKEVFCSIIQKEVTSQERIGSRKPSGGFPFCRPLHRFRHRMLSGCSLKGTVSYTAEMPDVFYRSKINLKPHAALHHFRHSAPRT